MEKAVAVAVAVAEAVAVAVAVTMAVVVGFELALELVRGIGDLLRPIDWSAKPFCASSMVRGVGGPLERAEARARIAPVLMGMYLGFEMTVRLMRLVRMNLSMGRGGDLLCGVGVHARHLLRLETVRAYPIEPNVCEGTIDRERVRQRAQAVSAHL